MLDLLRMGSMYTTWNWISIMVMYGAGLGQIEPYLRWNSLLILVGVLAGIMMTGRHLFADVLNRVTGREIPSSVAWLLDALIHLGPVLWLGLPSTVDGFGTALVGLITWYAFVRSRIQRVYTPTLSVEQYDRITQIVLVAGLCIYGVIWKVQDTGK